MNRGTRDSSGGGGGDTAGRLTRYFTAGPTLFPFAKVRFLKRQYVAYKSASFATTNGW